jgi:hypothetical protein
MIKNNNENSNQIVKNLGNALGSEIKLITNLHLLEVCLSNTVSSKEKYIVKDYSCLLGKSEVFLFNTNLDQLELLIPYTSIKEAVLDKQHFHSLILKVNKSELLDKSNYIKRIEKENMFNENQLKYSKVIDDTDLYVFIKNRTTFIKSLICYHSIYYLHEKNEVRDLKVSLMPIKHLKRVFISTSTQINHNLPHNYFLQSIGNLKFFLFKSTSDSVSENVFFIQSKNSSLLKPEITVFVGVLNFLN